MRPSLLRALAATAVTATLALTSTAQTIGCELGGTGGLLPATGTGGGGTFPTTLPTAPSVYTLNVASVPTGSTCVTAINLNGLTHTWQNDVQFVLTDPNGVTHNILCRPTGSCDYNGNYSIVEACTGGMAWPSTCVNPVPVGAYDQFFGTWPSGTNNIFNTPLSAIPAVTGVWTLTGYDWVSTDAGALTSWDICFGTPVAPAAPSAAPALSAPANNANVFGPYVSLSWASVGCATSYEVDVDGTIYPVVSSPFVFASAVGAHTWTVRGLNATGAGPWATSRIFNDQGLATPSLTAPAANASVFGPNVNLTWGAVANASGYDVDVDGTVYPVAASPFVFASTPGVHTWTVRAKWNGNTLVGPYAVARNFTDLGLPPQPCNGPSLATTFAGGNGLSSGSCVFFDVDVLNPAGITVSQLDQNTTSAVTTAFNLAIWTRAGTYVGSEQTTSGWTNVSNGAGVAVGSGLPSVVDVTDFPLAPGVTGFCVVITGAANTYTNGNGTNQFYSNADLTITLGKSQSAPFSGSTISPRVWNGAIRYNCNPPVTTYCTAGTSTNGCTPSMSSTGTASISQTSGFVLTATGVEGQKSGLVFYGISGRSQAVWGSGSTSFLCVKAPTQRMTNQSSGGTIGLCDGVLSEDWLAWISVRPAALGQPFAAGNQVNAQAWYRDPSAVKTTNLSNGIEYVVVP